MRYVTGVDLGGTNIVVGTVAEDGSELVGLVSEPTRASEGVEAVIGRIIRLARASMDEAIGSHAIPDSDAILGVGIGAPGPLHRDSGVVRVAPNLKWRDVPLRDRVGDALRRKATLDNDANCAVLGEWWQGAGQGAKYLVGITIGTGIGGGVVFDGELYHGASDIAGEIGHMTIDSTGRRCSCGNYGCLEAYASGPAIAERATDGLAAGVETELLKYVDGDADRLTAEIVYEAAQDGDPLAQQVVRDTAQFLGAGIANLVNIFNPELIVVLGGVTQAGPLLFQPLREEVNRRAFRPAAEVCKIVSGDLPGTAGVYGAARSFLTQL